MRGCAQRPSVVSRAALIEAKYACACRGHGRSGLGSKSPRLENPLCLLRPGGQTTHPGSCHQILLCQAGVVFDASVTSEIIRYDALRWRVLGLVRELGLPDCWIGAGFVRNAVWDHLHERPPTPPTGDVDVIWFDPARAHRRVDEEHEASLRAREPDIAWSLKNQARMHHRNGDPPYASATDAMRYWPETATAVAVRRTGGDRCEVAAPFGTDDLLGLVLRPGPAFLGEKRSVYASRLHSKRWTTIWPLLREVDS